MTSSEDIDIFGPFGAHVYSFYQLNINCGQLTMNAILIVIYPIQLTTKKFSKGEKDNDRDQIWFEVFNASFSGTYR